MNFFILLFIQTTQNITENGIKQVNKKAIPQENNIILTFSKIILF